LAEARQPVTVIFYLFEAFGGLVSWGVSINASPGAMCRTIWKRTRQHSRH